MAHARHIHICRYEIQCKSQAISQRSIQPGEHDLDMADHLNHQHIFPERSAQRSVYQDGDLSNLSMGKVYCSTYIQT